MCEFKISIMCIRRMIALRNYRMATILNSRAERTRPENGENSDRSRLQSYMQCRLAAGKIRWNRELEKDTVVVNQNISDNETITKNEVEELEKGSMWELFEINPAPWDPSLSHSLTTLRKKVLWDVLVSKCKEFVHDKMVGVDNKKIQVTRSLCNCATV